MRKHLLTALAGCAAALALALSVPRTALALPYYAVDPELAGTAYAVLSPTTGELDFVRWTRCSTAAIRSARSPSATGSSSIRNGRNIRQLPAMAHIEPSMVRYGP